MDFNEITTEHINKVIAEKLPQIIEEKATKMIESIIEDTFRWGDVKDQIKKKLQESINVNLLQFDLIDYNALIAKTINDNLLEQVNLQPIINMTQDIVGFVNKKTISLEDIAEMFIEASKEENYQEGEGEITFIVKENTDYKWVEIFADIEPNIDEYNCSIKFIFSTSDSREGKIFSFQTKDYRDSKHRDISPARIISMQGIEAQIFRLYNAQVQITNYDYEPSQYWDRY